MDTAPTPLDRAISLAGGITKLAGRLGLKSHSVIDQWRRNRVPAEHCPLIERTTRELAAESGGLPITCEELRPDVAWDVLRLQAAPNERRRVDRRSKPQAEGG